MGQDTAPVREPPQTYVIGAGVTGLATALALARCGRPVTLLERDPGRLPVSVDDAFERWDRRGVPQARHSHAFLARLRNLLRDQAPDVLDALLAAGVTELRFAERPPPEITDRAPRPGDEDLVALACRRTTFEWVFRQKLLAEPDVHLVEDAAVQGLVGTPERITGVRFHDQDHPAELVIDASGRRSPLASWLQDLGAPPPEDESVECGIVYLSRFYRLRKGCEAPPQEGPIGGDLGYLKYAVFVGDNDTFSVTFGTDSHESVMRPRLLRPELFDTAARNLPATRDWVDRAEPISDVEVMARLVNRRRRLVVDGRPVANGVVALGDALVHTNPLYGRGCSLGMVHAFGFADLMVDDDDPVALSLGVEELTRVEVDPWYRTSVMQDLENQRAARGEVATDDPMRSLMRDGLMPAVRTDADVFRAFLRVLNLLDPPDAMISDPAITGRILEVWQARGERPEPPADGPSQDEMLELLARAQEAGAA
jgi:2-polyprenyl-6-methoxyphenol hydroxylase-like FAD-dependent oxidoreductase